jgi:hypothetical protein
MKSLHIVQGGIDNGDKDFLEKASRKGLDAPIWVVPKSAMPGDDAVIYVTGYGFFATAVLNSSPQPRKDWHNRYGLVYLPFLLSNHHSQPSEEKFDHMGNLSTQHNNI